MHMKEKCMKLQNLIENMIKPNRKWKSLGKDLLKSLYINYKKKSKILIENEKDWKENLSNLRQERLKEKSKAVIYKMKF